ncbi:shikimate kinase [Helicobacter sp. 23-1046]
MDNTNTKCNPNAMAICLSSADMSMRQDSLPNAQNIVLIGFMGSGKSSVGKEISALCDYFFCDSDELIQSIVNKSINEIFTDLGESAFRNMESRLLQWLQTNARQCVIATGGGMPVFNDMRNLGVVVFLDNDFESIAKRLDTKQRESRPLFNDTIKAKELFMARSSVYKNQADIIISPKDCALSPKQIAQKIMDCILHLQAQ